MNQKSIKRGTFKDVYHYPISSNTVDEIIEHLKSTVDYYNKRIKINITLGFLLRHRITDDLWFFDVSKNVPLFNLPKLITTKDDYIKLVEDIEAIDIWDQFQRPSNKWLVDGVISVQFDVYKLESY